MTAPARRTRAKKAAAKQAEPAEPEAAEEEVLEGEEGEDSPKRKRDTTPLPSGEELYQAKYVDGMTWQEIRDNIDPRIRSPKGLALIADYVIENELDDEHPEFSNLQDLEGEELSNAIVEAHDAGQGWSVIAARTGLKIGEVQDIYADAGGENPGRVGGKRYGGGRSVGKATNTEEGEEEATEEGEEEVIEEEQPAAKKSAPRRRAAAKKASDNGEAPPSAKKAAPARRRQKAATPS
jgi:hypothetical protein